MERWKWEKRKDECLKKKGKLEISPKFNLTFQRVGLFLDCLICFYDEKMTPSYRLPVAQSLGRKRDREREGKKQEDWREDRQQGWYGT